MRAFQKVLLQEIFHRHLARLGNVEFLKPVLNGMVRHLYNVDHLTNGSPKVVHARSHQQTGTANAGRATAHDHPISAHPLHESDGILCHLGGVLVKLHLGCKPPDEIFGIDGDESIIANGDDFVEFFKDAAQLENVELDQVGQVNQHNLAGWFCSAGGVKTDCSHTGEGSSLDKVGPRSQLENLGSGRDQAVADIELLCVTLHETTSFPNALLPVLGAADSSEGGTHAPNASLVGANEGALDHGCTGRGLAKLDLGDDIAVVSNAATRPTSAIDNVWFGTSLVGTLLTSRHGDRPAAVC